MKIYTVMWKRSKKWGPQNFIYKRVLNFRAPTSLTLIENCRLSDIDIFCLKITFKKPDFVRMNCACVDTGKGSIDGYWYL